MKAVSGSMNFNEKLISIESVNASSRIISIGDQTFTASLTEDAKGTIAFDGGSGIFEVDATQTPPFHIIKVSLGEFGQFQISVISVTTVRVVFMRGKDVVSMHLEKSVSWIQKVTVFGDPKAVMGIVLVVLVPILLGFILRKLDTMKAKPSEPTKEVKEEKEKEKEKEE